GTGDHVTGIDPPTRRVADSSNARAQQVKRRRLLKAERDAATDGVAVVIIAAEDSVVVGKERYHWVELDSDSGVNQCRVFSGPRTVHGKNVRASNKTGINRIRTVVVLVEPGNARFGPEHDTVISLDADGRFSAKSAAQ